MKRFCFYSFAVLFLASGCTESSSENIDQEKTRAIVEHHWEAFVQNDLEAVMADYTEESILITPDTTFKGLNAIRENFIRAFEAFAKNRSSLQLHKTVVEQDVGYIIWQAKTPVFELDFASDTFIIRKGKIIRQTYAGVRKAL